MKRIVGFIICLVLALLIVGCGGNKKIIEANNNLNVGSILARLPDTEDCKICGGTGIEKYKCPKCKGVGEETCKDCNGTREKVCKRCNGTTELPCRACNGTGKDGTCSNCAGTGKQPCEKCDAMGKTICHKCDGEGKYTCWLCDGTGLKQRSCKNCGGKGYIKEK